MILTSRINQNNSTQLLGFSWAAHLFARRRNAESKCGCGLIARGSLVLIYRRIMLLVLLRLFTLSSLCSPTTQIRSRSCRFFSHSNFSIPVIPLLLQSESFSSVCFLITGGIFLDGPIDPVCLIFNDSLV